MTTVHNEYPAKEILFSECSTGLWSSFGDAFAWDMDHLIIGAPRNWARTILKWNVALDTNNGPHTGGCTNCTGLGRTARASPTRSRPAPRPPSPTPTRRRAAPSRWTGTGATGATPAVAISAPAAGAAFAAPASITVSADASSPACIRPVDFYAGNTLVGTDTSAPYSVTWSNVPAGSYTLTAKATDAAGATATSAGISITVKKRKR